MPGHRTTTAITAACVATLLGTIAAAPSTRPTTGPAHDHHATTDSGAERTPNLERSMKEMEKLLKGIDRQLNDAAKDESTLTMVNALQAATVAAKNIYPDNVGEHVGDAKKKAMGDYRARMLTLLRAELKVEESLLAGDRAAARAALAAIKQQQKDGHEAYGVDDNHHH